jgi:DNA-directed RNA polymerase specialized sigma24 family protein
LNYNDAVLSDELTGKRLERLLSWLAPDPQIAAEKYQAIHKRLTRLFVYRGSNTAEDLADRTIDRVARKIETVQEKYVGDPVHYFCSVAIHILRESIRRDRPPTVLPPPPAPPNENQELYERYLEACLNQLSADDRTFVLAYHRMEKRAKIDQRRELAAQLGVNMNVLRIRACRLRAVLEKCFMKEIGRYGH